MAIINLLYKHEYYINDKIGIVIPTVGEIVDNEESYYSVVSSLTSTPVDLMVALDDAGIDFTKINDYELFLLLFNGLKESDTSLVFKDLDLSKFQLVVNSQNGMVVLRDPENDIVIDRAIHGQIAATLRKIHHLERNNHEPGNEDAREFMLRRERTKMKRRAQHAAKSQIEPLIIAMVNTEQYPYGFEETRDLTIYQFNESVRQVIKKIDFDNRMIGVYAGTVSAKDLSQDDLNWLTHK